MTHAMVNNQETRKLREVVEIANVDTEGLALTNTPFIWNSIEDKFYFKKNSKILEKIARRYGLNIEEMDLEFRKRTQLIFNLYQNKITNFDEVQKIISEYHKKPEEVLRKFGVI